MKKTMLMLLFLCFTLLQFQSTVLAQGEENEPLTTQIVDKQLNTLGLQEIQAYWNEVIEEYGGFLPESQKGSFLEFIKGEKQFSLKAYLLGLLKFLFHELLVHGKLLGSLILLTIFSILLQNMQNAFEHKAVSTVAYGIIYMVLIILALNSFHVAIQYTESAIANMMGFLLALIPLLLALIASVGGMASVAFFHPIVLFLVNTGGLLIQKFVLPMLFLSAVLAIVSTISEQYKVTQLSNLLRNIAIGTLGVFFAVFLGVISVQGASTAVADGVTIRAAKFVTGNFIPVVGRMFTDATDTVLSASVLLKNTVGLAGVVILLMICAFPALKVLSLVLIYNIAAAVIQPLGGGPIIQSLNVISKSILFIFAALAIVSLMFFLAVTIIIASGNITLMVR
ncbi:stage III sporulation protein AE [Pseudalkalibacillus hwajinpoensis]|uniref:stage III sporulation protein AE n=1 Tax=Guptibacillus hwajinpoensis TaxID=208199 RepID=UPI001CD3E1B0|nr:stage III sporulation protein AE [Pseudalkalibacillus hwajinpoensis]MCA0990996.1 stage III sporulation protein AE [Pseudalkalibacillus hwajinpoensis]